MEWKLSTSLVFDEWLSKTGIGLLFVSRQHFTATEAALLCAKFGIGSNSLTHTRSSMTEENERRLQSHRKNVSFNVDVWQFYSSSKETIKRDFPPVASFSSELPILSHAPTTAIHFSAQQSLTNLLLCVINFSVVPASLVVSPKVGSSQEGKKREL